MKVEAEDRTLQGRLGTQTQEEAEKLKLKQLKSRLQQLETAGDHHHGSTRDSGTLHVSDVLESYFTQLQ